jgi:beta-glucosidase
MHYIDYFYLFLPGKPARLPAANRLVPVRNAGLPMLQAIGGQLLGFSADNCLAELAGAHFPEGMKPARWISPGPHWVAMLAAILLAAANPSVSGAPAGATLTAPAPEISRDPQGEVVIKGDSAGVVVHYTLDGQDPTRDAGAYLAPVHFPYRGTVKARTFQGDQPVGQVVAATFEALEGRARPHSALLPLTQNRDWRSYDWADRHRAVTAAVQQRKPQLVFIGDSITHFWGGEPLAKTGRAQEVWQKYYGKRNAVNLGFGWDRTENVLWRLQHGELDGAEPKVVVLLIGTNNLDLNTPEEIAEGIRAVCGELHARLPKTRILLLGILPRSPRPDARRAKLAEVNARSARLDGQDLVTYLDIGAKFVSADGSIAKEIMNDYLHPTAQGYTVFAEAIEPTLAKLLGEVR